MDPLWRRALRVASGLPVGDSTRKQILTALKKASRAPTRRDWTPGPAAPEHITDYMGYAGDTYTWKGGPVAGFPIEFHIEIGPTGRGDLLVRWSGAWWKTERPGTLQNLQDIATNVYRLMDEHNVSPGSVEVRGRSLFRPHRMASHAKEGGEDWLETERAIELALDVVAEIKRQGGKATVRGNKVDAPVFPVRFRGAAGSFPMTLAFYEGSWSHAPVVNGRFGGKWPVPIMGELDWDAGEVVEAIQSGMIDLLSRG